MFRSVWLGRKFLHTRASNRLKDNRFSLTLSLYVRSIFTIREFCFLLPSGNFSHIRTRDPSATIIGIGDTCLHSINRFGSLSVGPMDYFVFPRVLFSRIFLLKSSNFITRTFSFSTKTGTFSHGNLHTHLPHWMKSYRQSGRQSGQVTSRIGMVWVIFVLYRLYLLKKVKCVFNNYLIIILYNIIYNSICSINCSLDFGHIRNWTKYEIVTWLLDSQVCFTRYSIFCYD